MTELLQKSLNTNSPIAQECLRLLSAFLRACPEWAPTTDQLRFLVSWTLSDVEEAAAQVAAFSLLRGVIKRRLVVPEVYDVMSKVEDLMIRSQVCRQALLFSKSKITCRAQQKEAGLSMPSLCSMAFLWGRASTTSVHLSVDLRTICPL